MPKLSRKLHAIAKQRLGAIQAGQTGLLVPVQDEVALAEAIQRLAADLELRSRLGQNARKRVEQKFSREKVLESLLEFYRQL